MWVSSQALGRLEAAELEIAEMRVNEAARNELLLYMREDLREVKKDVKELLGRP
jgi:hypothetical protein